MAREDLTSDRVVEAAIFEVVTNHHPVNQSKLREVVKMYLPDVAMNRIRCIADSMANAGKLASSSVKQRSSVYDLP